MARALETAMRNAETGRLEREAGKSEYACATCGSRFKDWPSQRSSSSYCSHQCYAESLAGKPPPNKGKKLRFTKPCLTCGSDIVGPPHKVNRRKYCSYECFGKSVSGEKHPNWSGGSTKRQEIGNSKAYQDWRLAIVVRDGGACVWCASKGVRCYSSLEVHHIVPVSVDESLMYANENAITLCRECHNKTRGREADYAYELSALVGAVPLAKPASNRKDRTPIGVTREYLYEMYVNRRLSTGEIAKEHGCTSAAILKYLRKYEIPRRTARESQIESEKRRKEVA